MAENFPKIEEMVLARSKDNPFDPPAGLIRLQSERPLTRAAYPDGHVGWLASSHETVRAVLSAKGFSQRAELMHLPFPGAPSEPPPPAPPGALTGLDAPEHTRYRKLLVGQFTVRRMRQLTERVAHFTKERLDDMAEQEGPLDLVTAFAQPIPALTICELLGVPSENRAEFQRHAEVGTGSMDSEAMAEAFAAMYAMLTDLVLAKRTDPTDDLLSGLAVTDLTDEELINVAIVLLGAGLDTTANMLGLGTYALLLHPGQIPYLHEDPDRAVEELLRYLSITEATVRVALEDVEVDGHLIKAGDSVTVSMLAANRDPRKFPNPFTLDLTRSANGQATFGHGIHQCLGQQLARVEMSVAFPALFARFPGLRVAVPAKEVPLKTDSLIYGVRSLPIVW